MEKFNVQPGIALNPPTPLTTMEYLLTEVDMLLIMSVDPGFAKRVKDRFDAPMHYAIIFGYDALHVFARAIESAQSLDSVKIKDALKKTDYRGLEGHIKFQNFEGYRNQGRFVPSIVKWVSGQRTVVE